MRVVLILLALTICGIGFITKCTEFDKANALYNEGKYAEAIDNYEDNFR